MSPFTLRDAVEADLPAIVAIYNESIEAGWSTADTKPITVGERVDWFRKHDPARRPLWLAIDDADGSTVMGWIGLTSFYGGRPAYDATAELSMYIATAYQRRGLGIELKRRMIAACPRLGVTTLLSIYFDHNPGTEQINARLGFEKWGHLPGIAEVFGRKCGVVIAGLRIG